ncbi:hypothetical protein UCRPA7_5824 [Phaeoacremonium minimum UCRPA7]|uniref:Uncharacterized protein n=1 Tax=Phaeoacremonium minimum (strain UCR-PA7) TaxID=1286976 RepID=R8BH74_PHAM7|nr:hypothetical protein UCRPA7_5824 [Phaeoacremonium minimum UCRPA7]EON98663.1 hypothetical protein UCRPA7_5824 [Phaeoacremonium minimum UCRPA7]
MASILGSQERAQASSAGQSPGVLPGVARHDLAAMQGEQPDVIFAPGYADTIRQDVSAAEALRQHVTPSQIVDTGINPTLADLAEASRAPKRLADEDCDMGRAYKRYLRGPSRFVEHREMSVGTFPNDFIGKYSKLPHTISGGPFTIKDKILPCSPNFDFISSLCTSRELIITVCQHVKPRDVLSLMKASKMFYELFMGSLRANVWQLANGMAPGAARTFYWKFYSQFLVPDPTGYLPQHLHQRYVYPWSKHQLKLEPDPLPDDPIERRVLEELGLLEPKPRLVPGLAWLNMVVERERKVRDIIACLARSGHRLPRHAHISLKKMWLVMDCARNEVREALMRSRTLFSDFDLYNLQMFFIKLQMRFNEPIFGPESSELMQVLLGQKEGLDVMWGLLRRTKYTDDLEACIQLKIRYNYEMSMAQFMSTQPIHNVCLLDVGLMNLEGWGTGMRHLKRPDELVIREAARRHLRLSTHYLHMAVWGHIDIKKKQNLVPTEEELYMSDDELPPMHPKHPEATCGNVPFHPDEWQPKHAKKARWHTLTREEKLYVRADDIDEQLRDLIYEELPSDEEYDSDPFGGDFDMVPENTVRSTTWEAAPASASGSSAMEGCFKEALKNSNYNQAQQDAELSALASVAVKQSKMEMGFDDYVSDVPSFHTEDPMDIDEGNDEIDAARHKEKQRQFLRGTPEDDEEDIEPPDYDFRKF